MSVEVWRVAFTREQIRLYPQTSLAAHVLGYTDIDGHGVAGMEHAFDQYLSDSATRGEPLTLSIDSRVQQALERSEEHTSELQSHSDLVCRLLLEKKNSH